MRFGCLDSPWPWCKAAAAPTPPLGRHLTVALPLVARLSDDLAHALKRVLTPAEEVRRRHKLVGLANLTLEERQFVALDRKLAGPEKYAWEALEAKRTNLWARQEQGLATADAAVSSTSHSDLKKIEKQRVA